MASSMKGACLCEGVQFRVEGEPKNVFICYCTHCSKNAGAAGQISAKFKKEQVELEQGQKLLKTWILEDTVSGSEKHKLFCSQCGCTLWTIPMRHGGSHLIVRTSLLEDGLSRLLYKAEFFASRKAGVAADNVQSFNTMPGY
ncbi:GFA family protein [Aspergillus candidus]|uniref:Mss4-like protein n=1 Tax=Aspergillus candidus TaxID=41067 RepID=A0A2I2F2Z7_ASPCN|nr:Mss4-like protein [Aspergillus candidus]PLB35001.1 Mss4-like protein [Aspergillus candidus]